MVMQDIGSPYGYVLHNRGTMADNVLMTNTTRPMDADLRIVAFLLARTARAIRSDRSARAIDLICKAQDLIDRLPASPEGRRACQLVEALADVGVAHFAAAAAAAPPAWTAHAQPCPSCFTYPEPCLGCAV